MKRVKITDSDQFHKFYQEHKIYNRANTENLGNTKTWDQVLKGVTNHTHIQLSILIG